MERGDGGNNGRLKRETEGLGNEADHDGSIHHSADGTFVHDEQEIGKYREMLPTGTSVAQALAASSCFGDTKEDNRRVYQTPGDVELMLINVPPDKIENG